MFGDDIGRLRRLAASKGYTVERPIAGDRWKLISQKAIPGLGGATSVAFRYAEAMKFLEGQAVPPTVGMFSAR